MMLPSSTFGTVKNYNKTNKYPELKLWSSRWRDVWLYRYFTLINIICILHSLILFSIRFSCLWIPWGNKYIRPVEAYRPNHAYPKLIAILW